MKGILVCVLVLCVLSSQPVPVKSGKIDEDLRSAFNEEGFDIDAIENAGIEDAITDEHVGIIKLEDFASLTQEFFDEFLANPLLKLSIVVKSKLTRVWKKQQAARFPPMDMTQPSKGRKKKRRRRSVDKDACKAGTMLRTKLETPEKQTLYSEAGSPKVTWGDMKDKELVKTLAKQLTDKYEEENPSKKLKQSTALKAVENFFAGSRQKQANASSDEKKAEKVRADELTDHRMMRSRADTILEKMVHDGQLTAEAKTIWTIAFSKTENGDAGLLMTPSGESSLFNREHKFTYFSGMAKNRVVELKQIVKAIAGYAVNRKRAIRRPVIEASANDVVIATPNIKTYTQEQLAYLGVDPVVASDNSDVEDIGVEDV